MVNLPAKAYLIPFLLLGGTIFIFAQDWQTVTELNGVDFARLTGVQKTRALRLVRAQGCTCGCDMKIAECRVKDPGCVYSRGLAGVLVESLRKGKSDAAALADMKASRFAQRQEPKLLDDPVAIPTEGSPVTGPANARITLVEFSDFQCPFCSSAALKISAILKAFPNDAKLIFKQFPLDAHPQALISAQAAIAAHRQGKFWQLHDLMFANRTSLSRKAILGWAAGLGLDMKRFEADIDSDAVKKTVARDLVDGENAGVEGTPTIYINGQRYNGDLEIEALRPVIEAELKRAGAARKK